MGQVAEPENRSRSTDTADDLLTVPGAAALLGISEKALRARVARRSVPFRRLGRRIVFMESELAEFVRSLDGVRVDEAIANIARTSRNKSG
jgi:excisionase family DNA binding protein